MPKVVREDVDALNAVLSITIEKDEYLPKFNKELAKLRDKAAIKGFRRGKTPVGFLKKMYGKNLLGEIVTDLLQQEVSEFLKDDDLSYIGQPIPTEGHKAIDFDYNSTEDYTFSFDIGKVPVQDVKGIDKDTVLDYYKVEVPADKVQDRLDNILKRRGNRVESDAPIGGDDMIQFSAVELDGEAPKADGWKTVFSVLFDKVADGPVRDELQTKQKGDTLRFNIYELEAGASRESVKKYLLNFTDSDIDEGTETGEMYEGKIESVTRLVPAELTQEVLDQVFGEGVATSEEEAKAKIAENMGVVHTGPANTMLFSTMREHITDANRHELPLPEAFLMRWVKISDEKNADRILSNFDAFIEDLRWSVIKKRLYKLYNFQVEDQEIVDHAYNKVAGYFGGYYDQKMMEPIVNRMLDDADSVNGLVAEILTDKLFHQLKEAVTLREVPISEEAFNSKYQAFQDKERQKSATLGIGDEEE